MRLAENVPFPSHTTTLNTLLALLPILTADLGVPRKWMLRANTSMENGAIVNLDAKMGNKVRFEQPA